MIKLVLKTLFFCFPAFLVLSARGQSIAQPISTFAGTGTPSAYLGEGGPATSAPIAYTWHVAADTIGNVYFSDYSHNFIHKVSPAGIITTIMEPMNGPSGIAIDKVGNIYYCDAHFYRIRKVNTAGVITTIAGTGVAGFSGDGGPAIAAKVNRPNGICVDSTGKVYFADVLNNRVRAIDTAGIITTVAGTGIIGFSGDGGPSVSAQFTTPNDVALDRAGNLYIVDEGNQRIRKVNISGIITTFAGTGMAGFSGDGGPATAAQLFTPWGVTTDRQGNVYFSDHDNNRIRKIDSAGVISTIAGNDTAGYSGDGGPATAAKLNAPTGLAFDRRGNMYVCDWQNFRIRKIKTANIPPVFTDSVLFAIKLCTGDTLLLDSFLSVIDSNIGQTITWNIISGPHHGIASIACSTTDTNTMAISLPFGTTYTPDSAYSGFDTIKVLVTDGMSNDTVTRVLQIGPVAGPITVPSGHNPNYFCLGERIQLSGAEPGGTWSVTNWNATITDSGKLYGVFSGLDTIMYIITNSCGTDTATLNIHVSICSGVGNSELSADVNMFPNPNSGNFTIYLGEPLSEKVQIRIIDVMGRTIMNYNTLSNHSLEIKELPEGIYSVQYVTPNFRGSKVVVVSN